jgi:hypothetical protein
MLDFRPRGYKVLLDLSTGPRWQLVHVNAAPMKVQENCKPQKKRQFVAIPPRQSDNAPPFCGDRQRLSDQLLTA